MYVRVLYEWQSAVEPKRCLILDVRKSSLQVDLCVSGNRDEFLFSQAEWSIPSYFIKLIFDVYNDSAPSNITKLFTRTSNIHTYNTRSSTSQFFSVKYSRLKMQKKVFSRVGFKVWNEMPNEYKNLSKKSFKKETKRALLNILETEDSYMEPDEIMLKFKHSKIESN